MARRVAVTGHGLRAWACAWALALGPLATGAAAAAPAHAQCAFDPTLIAAFAEASNQSRRQAGGQDWTQADLERSFNQEWDSRSWRWTASKSTIKAMRRTNSY